MTLTIRKSLAATALAVLAAVGVPSSASASTAYPPGPTVVAASSAARSVVVVVKNDSDCSFILNSATLWHGVWSSPLPGVISPHTTVSWLTESNGFMTGVEGEVHYIPGQGCTNHPPVWTVYWDDPYSGSNSYFWEFNSVNPDHWSMTMSGGAGNNATINFRLFV